MDNTGLNTMLADLGLNIGIENLGMCKDDVSDLKTYFLRANPDESSGLNDPTGFGKRKRYINYFRKQRFGNE